MSNKKFLSVVASLCSTLLFQAAPVFGAHPLLTDDTLTQGKGKAQIEMSYLYDSNNDDGIKTEASRPKVQLTYGLLDPLDIILEIPYLFTQQTQGGTTTNNDGIADITLSLKWRFYGEKEKGLQFAIKPSVTFPTGDEAKGLGFGREAYGITFISTFEREEWLVTANLGYLYNDYGLQSERDANRPSIWSASLAGQYEFVKKLWLVGEVGVSSNPSVTSDTPLAFINGGFIYELTKSIDLDIGYKYGLTKPAVDYMISGAVTVRF
ncbi:MAG TPA: transporter [Syntrophales bacterium]|nr:transporter [Syntrophales bacterium]